MKAVGYRTSLPIAASEALIDFEALDPVPGARDLLIAVEAISVNPVDTKVRVRAAPSPGETKILGWDAVGVVKAVGKDVTLFRTGDAVYYAGSIARPGANSELHLVDERIAGHRPKSLSAAAAAALPLTAITAWELLFDRLGVALGKRLGAGALLVVGGAGGVGSILIQLAARLTGLTVIATASRPDTVAWCRKMGAHHVIDHAKGLVAELKRIDIPQIGYIAALTATDRHLAAYAEIIQAQGKIAVIDDPAVLDIVPFKRKSVSVHWEFMFARPVHDTPDQIAQHHLLNEVAALVDSGVLKTTMTQNLGRIDATNLKRAHALLESGRTIGKVVLEGF